MIFPACLADDRAEVLQANEMYNVENFYTSDILCIHISRLKIASYPGPFPGYEAKLKSIFSSSYPTHELSIDERTAMASFQY